MKDKKEKENQKNIKKILPKLVSDIVPVVNFDEEHGFFTLENGLIMDMFKIRTRDLSSLHEDELEYDNLTWDKMYRVYADDLKIVSFNFATDTSKQQKTLKHYLDNTKNPIFKELLEEKISETEIIHNNFKDREFCLMFFAKDYNELSSKKNNLYSLMSRGNIPLLEYIENLKKKKIIYKLNNQCEEKIDV